MALLWQFSIQPLIDGYKYYKDPRVANWFMMSGPMPTLIICLSYAYFSKVIGPKLMENRKPFKLRLFMIYYNLFQVILSAWLFLEGMKYGWWNDYSYRCQAADLSSSPKALGMAGVCWWYYMSKFTEFFDTFLFVLRKKNDQISNLHVIHHGIMPFSTWFGVKLAPGGHLTFFGLVNTFVHIIMYGYYLLAALGPRMQPYLWWKKYLTTLQILQFVIVLLHASQLLIYDCDYPKILMWWVAAHAVLFILLFQNFYIKSYIKKENKKVT